ncbi:hypothetical protein CFE70_008629 [Pyrenophora teres f. teres 0-1]|uniref:Uncharacterized protein n=2 Tax=Pyrenophora teres f. teres TaxID=97479 RepID=E3RN24_PYRTT|nr:hypothetical protein PTT_09972 [Pyrenophora teres f. teres 0-1]KAE8824992.1 hypothetical protein PTNB85_09756 [Pyrenophora teres f. teres]KAE8831569.1 hypothetical protein HRS9139_05811 [Pyrenophora teres f. teres]KAE8835692.1 hypothetical protein HRS9122_07962 [Pyrenophora teres f. teres]KAE8858593.1 hypothetical protein PTNB29_07808 [Pyrenophora teres f. teres]
MSTQVPFRSVRISSLQRQCLFLRHQSQSRPHNLSLRQPTISTARAFSSTPSRPAKRRQLGTDKAQTKAAAASNIGAAPAVSMDKAESSLVDTEEDIGLLQNTIIRAPFRELWKEGLSAWPAYFWQLIKGKGTALYSRFLYRTCVQKSGWSYYTPIDPFEHTQFKYIAKKHYEQLYTNFAAGNIENLKKTCLAPYFVELKHRIAARGNLHMNWQIHGDISSRIVSHRAAPVGESRPDTAYRQLVIRLKSTQSVTRSLVGSQAAPSSTGPRHATKKLAWMPDAAREQMQRERKEQAESGGARHVRQLEKRAVFVDNGVPKTVVEYLVLQKRVIEGEEEQDWKVWGFAQETTPTLLKEDEEYWRSMLNYQTA